MITQVVLLVHGKNQPELYNNVNNLRVINNNVTNFFLFLQFPHLFKMSYFQGKLTI